MKTLRGAENDFEVIKEIIAKNRISKNTVLARINNEMKHVIGNPKALQLKYAMLLEQL
jgi:hypothetical protein